MLAEALPFFTATTLRSLYIPWLTRHDDERGGTQNNQWSVTMCVQDCRIMLRMMVRASLPTRTLGHEASASAMRSTKPRSRASNKPGHYGFGLSSM